MRLESTGASLRNFIINQKTWSLRVKREKKVFEDPDVMSRLGIGTEIQKVDKAATSHKDKVKAVRAWNLRQNWKFGQVNISAQLRIKDSTGEKGEVGELQLQPRKLWSQVPFKDQSHPQPPKSSN